MKVGGLAPVDDVREVERIRACVGPGIDLMVDANGAYDARTAVRLGRELERLEVAWFEEPVRRGDLAGYGEVRRALDLPVAGGEHMGGLDALRELVGRRAVDILHTDVANCGGLAEAGRIAGLGQAFHVRVFPHVWGTPLAVPRIYRRADRRERRSGDAPPLRRPLRRRRRHDRLGLQPMALRRRIPGRANRATRSASDTTTRRSGDGRSRTR